MFRYTKSPIVHFRCFRANAAYQHLNNNPYYFSWNDRCVYLCGVFAVLLNARTDITDLKDKNKDAESDETGYRFTPLIIRKSKSKDSNISMPPFYIRNMYHCRDDLSLVESLAQTRMYLRDMFACKPTPQVLQQHEVRTVTDSINIVNKFLPPSPSCITIRGKLRAINVLASILIVTTIKEKINQRPNDRILLPSISNSQHSEIPSLLSHMTFNVIILVYLLNKLLFESSSTPESLFE